MTTYSKPLRLGSTHTVRYAKDGVNIFQKMGILIVTVVLRVGRFSNYENHPDQPQEGGGCQPLVVSANKNMFYKNNLAIRLINHFRFFSVFFRILKKPSP